MRQIALDIGLANGPTLKGFFAGPNEAALRHLELWTGDARSGAPARSPVPSYLWGAEGSGKTHLLKAVQAALREQGASSGWLDAGMLDPPEFSEGWAAVLLDQVHHNSRLPSTGSSMHRPTSAACWPPARCRRRI